MVDTLRRNPIVFEGRKGYWSYRIIGTAMMFNASIKHKGEYIHVG